MNQCVRRWEKANRPLCSTLRQRSRRPQIQWPLIGLVAAGLLMLPACSHQQTRLQAEDDSEIRDKEYDIQTIGDVSGVGNADPIPVSGVGLVIGLDGTGGNPPPGTYRTLLEDQLTKRGVQHVKQILASPNNSLVLVSALIPAGAHKGDSLDVEITLADGSRTTSLRGGILKDCWLYNYDNKKNLSPDYQGPNSTLLGHIVGSAEGPLLVGFGDGDESAKVRQGRIWGGGRSKIDRPFVLVLNENKQQGAVAQRIAERINESFHGPYHGPTTDMAVAQTGSVVYLRVPHQYRHNLPRYLRVVRLIPLDGNGPALRPYRRRLEEQLLDPAHAVTAALRLEALGPDSVNVLKHGLQSKHTLVRFCSAEALAYLGSPACGEELALLTEQQPALRAFCLTALASLDEAICHIKLRALMASASAETRYGAFRALRSLDENDPAVVGEELNNSFWLHRVAGNSPPLVHVSSSRRAEIVLFGETPRMVPPFSFLAGDFTVTAARGDERCTISRFSLQHGTGRRQCSLQLEDVLHTMADMGGLYPDVFELLRQCGTYESLSCAVARDALPQATSVYDLAKHGAGANPDAMEIDEEIKAADFGDTPTLYEKGTSRRSLSAAGANDEAASDEPAKEGTKSGGRKHKPAA